MTRSSGIVRVHCSGEVEKPMVACGVRGRQFLVCVAGLLETSSMVERCEADFPNRDATVVEYCGRQGMNRAEIARLRKL